MTVTSFSRPRAALFASAVLMLASATGVTGQETTAPEVSPSLSVELNSTKQQDSACQLTFFMNNTLPSDISGLVFEAVLLTQDGAVDRLTLFDMGALPNGRARVRQFNVPDLSCTKLGMVLINGVASCEGGDLTPAACTDAMTLSSRIDVEVAG